MNHLLTISRKKIRRIIGLMSGTSCDGIDLVIADITGCGLGTKLKLIATYHKPYSINQKSFILEAIYAENNGIKTVSQMNFYLAQIWAEAIYEMLQEHKISAQGIDLIGSHGQTFYHQPQEENFGDRQIRSTLQIGDPAVLAQLTGIATIGDFRVADMAQGGQGAPLVPYFDWIVFSPAKENLLALNIGGIANITFIPDDGDINKVVAFDTGPGNMLIDQFMQRMYELSFDRNGEHAAAGKLSEKLLRYLQKEDSYPQLPPPKSTGRERYGKDFVIHILHKCVRWRLSELDTIHTISYYTAYTIWQAYQKFISKPVKRLIVGGGGSHNSFLMQSLQSFFEGCAVETVREWGIDEDFKEALCFAVLANELICGNPAGMPSVTGAKKAALLGKICPVL